MNEDTQVTLEELIAAYLFDGFLLRRAREDNALAVGQYIVRKIVMPTLGDTKGEDRC